MKAVHTGSDFLGYARLEAVCADMLIPCSGLNVVRRTRGSFVMNSVGCHPIVQPYRSRDIPDPFLSGSESDHELLGF